MGTAVALGVILCATVVELGFALACVTRLIVRFLFAMFGTHHNRQGQCKQHQHQHLHHSALHSAAARARDHQHPYAHPHTHTKHKKNLTINRTRTMSNLNRVTYISVSGFSMHLCFKERQCKM